MSKVINACRSNLRQIVMIGLMTSYSLVSAQGTGSISIRKSVAMGNVYMLDCVGDFGGGNVAASVGPDGILLVDNMFRSVTPKMLKAIQTMGDSVVRFVVNSHFHQDHIEGNALLSGRAVIIGHANLRKRLAAGSKWAAAASLPQIVFEDKLTLYFNGEEIRIFHLPNGHTDNDVFVYFTKSNVIHMGDTYFKGMFPAVYAEGGGDILQLIKNLEKILADLPANAAVIPGHGDLASKADLVSYVGMLKETIGLVQNGLRAGKTFSQMDNENLLAKYNALGDGGAQTTKQYLAMLCKLLAPK